MTPEQWREIKPILQGALDMEPADRIAYLESLQPALRAEVESLISSYDDRGDLLEQPVLGIRAAPAPTTPGLTGKRFGPYRALSLLGLGGMGSVWMAERVDGLFTRHVALKLIHPALSGWVMTERLAREREILASLDHPNIARLLDAGFAEDGQPYLALQYVAGVPLTNFCDDHRLAIRQRLELFQQVLDAVQYAHAHLVVHRDIKPSNILVTAEGRVQLLDFGIAKLLADGEAKETELTHLGGRALTPDYAAPEQITGAPITTAADVYGLGVLLHVLLTGELPYRLRKDSRGALEDAILLAEPTAPSRVAASAGSARLRATTPKQLAKALKGDIDTMVSKALKKAPAARYLTVNAFAEDMKRFLRGEPLLAQRDSIAYRTNKFVRRHWVALSVVSALILTLTAGLLATMHEASVASRQKDLAVQAQLRSLTQTAAGRLRDADGPGAMAIVLELASPEADNGGYTPEALNVFQEARAQDPQVLAITGHSDHVFSAAFSSDGRRIITASRDKTAGTWDAVSGRRMLVLNHSGSVNFAAFSPDDRLIVTTSRDKNARVWSAQTGSPLLVLSGHTDRVLGASFSPDGRRIATTSNDRTTRLWDAGTGRQIGLFVGHTDSVRGVAFSADGARLVTASFDKTARIWDIASGRQLRVLTGHTNAVESAAFSPDSRHIVTASYDRTARVWDTESGRQLLVLIGHRDGLLRASYSPNGQAIVTASTDRTARVWDAATGQPLLNLIGHAGYVSDGEFSPDGRRIVTASIDKTARVWDISSASELRVLTGHTDVVASAVYSADGRRIGTASGDKTARIWDAVGSGPVTLLTGHTDSLNGAAFSPHGERLVTASNDRTARVWDAASGRVLWVLSGHNDIVANAVFSPDGARIATASYDRTARIWDAATARQLIVLSGHTDRVDAAAFSPDGLRVATASSDSTVRIWDAKSGRSLRVLRGHTLPLQSVVFSPDGGRIATGSDDKTARVWDAATGRQLLMLSGHTGPVNSAQFSPDAHYLVTSSNDQSVRIWDAAKGAQLQVLSGHTDIVATAAYSPDGRYIVTASNDLTARIWDARTPALADQLEWARAAQFDPLSRTERFELGLPAPGDVRDWPVNSRCDQLAAAPYDPARRAPGVSYSEIDADEAAAACAASEANSREAARRAYQHGRALAASGDFSGAQRDFMRALDGGYQAADVDLGMLLSRSTLQAADAARLVSLYERAWKNGIIVAAFELGHFYEQSDAARASEWYRLGAAAGEPNSLSRLGERDDAAADAEPDPDRKIGHLLESFRYYAAAAELARRENWPEDASRNWRYRRASLARMLARQGRLQEVADTYRRVREQYASRQ
jgi:WD40 repeat protein/serine/threonine protein kinase